MKTQAKCVALGQNNEFDRAGGDGPVAAQKYRRGSGPLFDGFKVGARRQWRLGRDGFRYGETQQTAWKSGRGTGSEAVAGVQVDASKDELNII